MMIDIPQKIKEKIPEKYKIDNLPLIGEGCYKSVYSKNDYVIFAIPYSEFDDGFIFNNELEALKKLKEIGLPYIPYLDYCEISYDKKTWIFALAEKYEIPDYSDLEKIKHEVKVWANIISKNNLYFSDLQIMKKNNNFFLHDPFYVKERTSQNVICFHAVFKTLGEYLYETLRYVY